MRGCSVTKARARSPRLARAYLRLVYGWFTEGFATKDLRDARALLDELADAPALPASAGLASVGAGVDGEYAGGACPAPRAG
jgi:hypothetical protein